MGSRWCQASRRRVEKARRRLWERRLGSGPIDRRASLDGRHTAVPCTLGRSAKNRVHCRPLHKRARVHVGHLMPVLGLRPARPPACLAGTHRKHAERGAPSAQPPTPQPEHRDEDDNESMSAGAGHSVVDMIDTPPQQRNLGRSGRGKRNCNLIRPQSLRVVDSQVSARVFCFSAALLHCAPWRETVLGTRIRVHPSARTYMLAEGAPR